MSDVVIRAEGLGKKYLIGHETERERYTALRDVVGHTAKGLLRSAGDLIRGRQLVAGDEVEEIWALKDVSFEIKRGEVVGIIGRNGAGKSTLLKILSRITEPSAGRVEIRGRVASLLEVGTGFHPELTGRENIYLNGAILGMTRAEIRRKFDEIVDFAGVEKFLDTPVKRYSSGMYVRLAFAVAAHLEPEILVVDEVLAVGDAEFQKKCLGKMGEVARGGRTVLFVSHNLTAVKSLCPICLYLVDGHVQQFGKTPEVISQYLSPITQSFSKFAERNQYQNDKPSDNPLEITDVQLLDGSNSLSSNFPPGSPLTIRIHYHCEGVVLCPAFGIKLMSPMGIELARISTMPISGFALPPLEGSGLVELFIHALPLTGGTYSITVYATRPNIDELVRLDEIVSFRILDSDIYNSGFPMSNKHGYLYLPHKWHHEADVGAVKTVSVITAVNNPTDEALAPK